MSPPDQPNSQVDAPATGLRAAVSRHKALLLAGGAGVMALGFVFWRELALLTFLVLGSLPNQIGRLIVRSDTRFHDTRAWERQEPVEANRVNPLLVLSTRMAPGNGQAFLVTQYLKDALDDSEPTDDSLIRRRDVYSYDPARKRLESVPDELWDGASSEILVCTNLRDDLSRWKVVFHPSEGAVTVNHRRLELAGAKPIAAAVAPNRRLVAVVSAAQGMGGFSWPGLGGSPAGSGQHFHQVFALDDANGFGPPVPPLGPPVRLPSWSYQLSGVVPDVCWSADESHVIYARRFSGMAIVAVDPDSELSRRHR